MHPIEGPLRVPAWRTLAPVDRVVAGTLCPFRPVGSIPYGDLRSEDTSSQQWSTFANGGHRRMADSVLHRLGLSRGEQRPSRSAGGCQRRRGRTGPRLVSPAVLRVAGGGPASRPAANRNRVVAGTLCPFRPVGSIPYGDLRSEDTNRPRWRPRAMAIRRGGRLSPYSAEG